MGTDRAGGGGAGRQLDLEYEYESRRGPAGHRQDHVRQHTLIYILYLRLKMQWLVCHILAKQIHCYPQLHTLSSKPASPH